VDGHTVHIEDEIPAPQPGPRGRTPLDHLGYGNPGAAVKAACDLWGQGPAPPAMPR
jgi:hypothetical protein